MQSKEKFSIMPFAHRLNIWANYFNINRVVTLIHEIKRRIKNGKSRQEVTN